MKRRPDGVSLRPASSVMADSYDRQGHTICDASVRSEQQLVIIIVVTHGCGGCGQSRLLCTKDISPTAHLCEFDLRALFHLPPMPSLTKEYSTAVFSKDSAGKREQARATKTTILQQWHFVRAPVPSVGGNRESIQTFFRSLLSSR